jgi:hypothetical protein
MATLPDDEPIAGRALHISHVAGDPTASNEIFLRYYELLNDHLREYIARKNLYLQNGETDEVAGNAVLKALETYLRKPDSYDPTLKTLGGYLQMSARGDFLNLLDREIKREAGNTSGIVRFDFEGWNTLAHEDSDLVEEIEDASAASALLTFARSCAHTNEDRTVLALMLTFEKRTVVFAEALGIAHLPEKEQRARVNTVKDRLSKRLKRGYRGGSADGTDEPGTR